MTGAQRATRVSDPLPPSPIHGVRRAYLFHKVTGVGSAGSQQRRVPHCGVAERHQADPVLGAKQAEDALGGKPHQGKLLASHATADVQHQHNVWSGGGGRGWVGLGSGMGHGVAVMVVVMVVGGVCA